MFKRKFICTMLSLAFLSSFMIEETSYAMDSSEIDNYYSYEFDSTEFPVLSEEETAAFFADAKKAAEENITPELLEEVEEILNDLNISEETPANPNLRYVASVDSISLEAALDKHDGMSVSEIFKVGVTHANNARDTAVESYTNLGSTVEMKRDAFRHSYWNFLSIQDVGENATRIATINHEWVARILPDVQAYEEERYKYYSNMFAPGEGDAFSMAVSDAYAYAITYRDELIKNCKESYAAFNVVFFNNAYIMDFWNNRVGRYYGKNNPDQSWLDLFPTVWNANKLIKHEGDDQVTTNRRISVHRSNWWYIS